MRSIFWRIQPPPRPRSPCYHRAPSPRGRAGVVSYTPCLRLLLTAVRAAMPTKRAQKERSEQALGPRRGPVGQTAGNWRQGESWHHPRATYAGKAPPAGETYPQRTIRAGVEPGPWRRSGVGADAQLRERVLTHSFAGAVRRSGPSLRRAHPDRLRPTPETQDSRLKGPSTYL